MDSRPHHILKTPHDLRVTPHLIDYDAERTRFSWEAARRQLAGLPGGGLNLAYEAVDRHLSTSTRDHIALRWIGKRGERRYLSYGQLAQHSNRFANVLRALGVGKGDRLFILCGRILELYIAALGALKNGTVVSPLFSAFGPEPLQTRLAIGQGKVLVTTATLYQRKVAPIRDRLPALQHVLLVGEEGRITNIPGTLDLAQQMADVSASCSIEPTQPEDAALLHFTSGTTGTPKGALHVHGAALTHWATGRYALDLHADDVYWCTADPGWVTGTSYGIVAPLMHGVTSIIDEAEFDADHW